MLRLMFDSSMFGTSHFLSMQSIGNSIWNSIYSYNFFRYDLYSASCRPLSTPMALWNLPALTPVVGTRTMVLTDAENW